MTNAQHYSTGTFLSSAGKFLVKFLRANRGATIIEFAVVLPVFLVALLGSLDFGQLVWGQALLNGAVQDAARKSALETADIAAADAKVESMVTTILPGVDVSGERVSYYDFADIERAERWNDVNSNGNCDNGEAFTDENRSGDWDADVGVSGNGGANDVVIYSVEASFMPIVSIPLLWGSQNEKTLRAVAVRKISLLRFNKNMARRQVYAIDSWQARTGLSIWPAVRRAATLAWRYIRLGNDRICAGAAAVSATRIVRN